MGTQTVIDSNPGFIWPPGKAWAGIGGGSDQIGRPIAYQPIFGDDKGFGG